jgi:hypothetical protein
VIPNQPKIPNGKQPQQQQKKPTQPNPTLRKILTDFSKKHPSQKLTLKKTTQLNNQKIKTQKIKKIFQTNLKFF